MDSGELIVLSYNVTAVGYRQMTL